ncbi:hypothetical protein JNB63_10755 [Microbacterium trichothecenolyticum]|uniref:Esterase Ig-like N-terminal domain-containing protein n=1 Tax=Microbacterium ureisolvens TaxID=2781186 RepID=A0ABS7HYK3_9MICO|nr:MULTISPECIES: hypothetical protein [Microbacterium]MBW9110471.1 hypothetical protein [Microbacterium ureisolvens]MBW9120576.1 hypothetical protein [Microbacterium trichothecenolyticum]
MNRKLGAAAVIVAVAAATFVSVPAAQAAPRQLRAVDATVITEVTPVGIKATGLAVEYDGTVDLGSVEIDTAAFDVDVTLTRPGMAPATGKRTVVDAYSNDDTSFSDQQKPGRFIILELDDDDALAPAVSFVGREYFYNLHGAYTVSQVQSIVGNVPRAGHSGHEVNAQRINGHPGRDVTNSEVRNLIIEDFGHGTFVADSGTTLPYRYFTPKLEQGKSYPLVVTLHGAGESGTDNFAQLAGNQLATAFADPARQARHSAYVLSPQTNPSDSNMGRWPTPTMVQTVVELVEQTLADNPQIDPDRIYISGVSMGSMGSWSVLQERSDLFAGALLICGRGDEAAAVANLSDFPIWAVHSIDDANVAYDAEGSDYRIFRAFEDAGVTVTWSEWSGLGSDVEKEAAAAEALDRAHAEGSSHLFTTFPAGTTPVFPHGSWIPTYTNDVIIDWLFAQ